MTNTWLYNDKPIDSLEDFPEGAIGFIYKITNTTNNKYYIGRKTARSLIKKKLTLKEKKLEDNKGKRFTKVWKESNWKKYWGSSKPLLEAIDNGDHCTRIIIKFCFSKAEITYYEAKTIICSDALLDENSYNSWISAKVYGAHLKQTLK